MFRTFGTITFGSLAVDLFFLISGYLILKSWVRRPNLLLYSASRFYRILPGFIVASVISVVVCALALAAQWPSSATDVLSFAFGAITLSVPMVPFGFDGTRYVGVNVPLWSIRYEFGCYLLVPLLMLLPRPRLMWPILAVLFAVLLGIGRLAQADQSSLSLLAGSVIRLPMFFLCGGCFYFYLSGHRPSPILLAVSVLVLLASFSISWLVEPALAICGGYLLFSVAWYPMLHRVGQRLPDISYGVYLYGWPISKLWYLFLPALGALGNAALSIVFSLGFGYLSWMGVERHFLRTSSSRLQPAS